MTAYAEKLKDPRWQKKRLEILERDEWTCQRCGDKESMLVVHHRLYYRGHEPWDYPNELLVTVCDPCHQGHHAGAREAETNLLRTLAMRGAWYEDLQGIAFDLEHFATLMDREQWLVFQHHLGKLISRLGNDYEGLKAERDAHVREHGFTPGAHE